ncbi:MAG: hypothetical protein GX793_04880 [Bacteroidales bacterium]|nr:hypothetical protein [Bacteroidales bacterium]
MELNTIEIFGYLASALIALSMAVSSIIKFRWINLIGALGLTIYAIIISAIPVAIVNALIVVLDIYYLYKAYTKNEIFQTIEIGENDNYLKQFIEFYKNDIKEFFPNFEYKPENKTLGFLILRNMNVTGVFIAKKLDDKTYNIDLDYVSPEYRDFKNGKYIYSQIREKFLIQSCTKVKTQSTNKTHIKYLKKIGFKNMAEGEFEMDL